MGHDRKATHRQLTALWKNPALPELDVERGPIAVLSDTHLGDGGDSDDFHPNEPALLAALRAYLASGATVVLLGDVEELWQFDLERIRRRYDQTVYAGLRAFPPGRVLRVFGNHDIEWASPPDPGAALSRPAGAPEGVRLRRGGAPFALLVHGHQGSLDSDRYAWFSRFVVRGVFKPIEPLLARIGLYRHPSATRSMVLAGYEQIFYAWARRARVLLVCGHSHRAIFASESWADRLRETLFDRRRELAEATRAPRILELRWEISKLERELDDERDKGRDVGQLDPAGPARPCYFNSGCGLYSNGVTALELGADRVRLVRWPRAGDRDPEELQAAPLAAICAAIAGRPPRGRSRRL